MVINRKVLPWLIAGVALAAILLIVLVMVTQAAPDSVPHRQGASISPGVVSYQGQVNIGGVPFSGTGYFRFAIVDSGGTFYWSNDGSTITPTDAVTLTVVSGLFNVLLGETNPITYGMFSNSDRWLRVWFDDGVHGVQLLEPDAPFTTAPFAFQADNATTAMTATVAMNAITFNTSQPSIIGDPYNGDPRGLYAVDLQLARGNPNQTACGPYSTISGGRSNVAGGSYSVVGGGWENYVGGYIATVVGGRLNNARGNYCVASGFRADTGINRNGVFIFGDSSDENFTGIINDEFAIRARGGFRHAYNDSNWWTAKVTSGGAVTFDSVGTTPGFAISDSLTVNGVFSATVFTSTYATTALTATNATTATYATTALTATNATTATYATTALTATNATTATYATTALTATNATTATYASTVPGFIIVQLAMPVIAINTTTLGTVAVSTEITNTTLGIPTTAKGILYDLTVADPGVAGQYFRFGPSATYFYQTTVTTQVSNQNSRDNGLCFTDSNGSIWYRSAASGSNTLVVYMRVWGYLK